MSSGGKGDRKPSKPYYGNVPKKRGGGYRKGFGTKATYQPKFKGKTEELKGFIYDIGVENQADLFMKTTKEIAEYAGRLCKQSLDIKTAIETLSEATIPIPTDRGTPNTTFNSLMLGKDLDIYVKRLDQYNQNKSEMYSKVLGQCTDALRAKLEAVTNYVTYNVSGDVVSLLNLVRTLAYDYEAQRYPFLALHSSLKTFYGHSQKAHESNDQYRESFQAAKEVVEHCGADIGKYKVLADYIIKEDGADPATTGPGTVRTAAENKAKEAYDGIAFMCGLNGERYQSLMDDLANNFLTGEDKYPKSLVGAYNLVVNWKGGKTVAASSVSDGVAFTTYENEDEEFVNAYTDKVIRKKNGQAVKCFICGKNHYADKCPEKVPQQDSENSTRSSSDVKSKMSELTDEDTKKKSEVPVKEVKELAHVTDGVNDSDWSEWDQNVDYSGCMFFCLGDDNGQPEKTDEAVKPDKSNLEVNLDHVLKQANEDGKIHPLWTLLDSQSTVDLFCNGKMLRNIHEINTFLKVYSTGGVTTTNKIGFLPGYGWVWYHADGIANILSLARVIKKFRVTFDSGADNEFHVHVKEDKNRSFKQSKKGLYYLNLCKEDDVV